MTRMRRLTGILYVCVVSGMVLCPVTIGAEGEHEAREKRERAVRERRERERHEREDGGEARERRGREQGEEKERREREHGEERERAERREDGDRRARRREAEEFRGVRGAMHQALRGVPEREQEHVIRFVHEHFEGELAEAEELAREEPGEAREIVTDVVHEARELLELRQEHPEAFEKAMHRMAIERRSLELAERYRASKGEAREQLLKELRGVLSEAFSLRQAAMKGEMRELEEELDRLQTLVQKREANRDAIVERRIEELIGEDEYLDW